MKILEDLNLELFELDITNFEKIDNCLIVTKKNWNYEKALNFQEEMIERVYKNPEESVFIFCNHPSCLTIGKGLQKSAEDIIDLVDFDQDLSDSLPVNLYSIKRGGGVTFHHDNQIVFYPIIALENKKLKVFDLLLSILEKSANSLNVLLGTDKFSSRTDLLGLWCQGKKVGSIGISARKFVSYHGLAINLNSDELINRTLEVIYPCGLPGSWYSPVNELLGVNLTFEDVKRSLWEEFKSLI